MYKFFAGHNFCFRFLHTVVFFTEKSLRTFTSTRSYLRFAPLAIR